MSASRPVPPGPAPVERVRGEPPDDASWRADALAQSRHARLSESLVTPLEDRDPERAARLCAEVCRADLADLAPALVLLPGDLRLRAQAATAWARTLFDFVRQSGLEGERLALVNRWEFELEAALTGRPAGQPVFVALAALHEERPFDERVFDLPLAVARRRIAVRRPPTAAASDTEARRLAQAALLVLAPDLVPADALLDLASGLFRLRRLLAVGDDRRRKLESLPADELPDDSVLGRAATLTELIAALDKEMARVAALVGSPDALKAAPRDLRPAFRYLRSAGRGLLRGARRSGIAVLDGPPSLTLARRLACLALARVGWA